MTQLNVNDWPLVNLFDGQPDYFLGYSSAQGPMRVAMSRVAAELAAGSALTVEFGRPMYVRVK